MVSLSTPKILFLFSGGWEVDGVPLIVSLNLLIIIWYIVQVLYLYLYTNESVLSQTHIAFKIQVGNLTFSNNNQNFQVIIKTHAECIGF